MKTKQEIENIIPKTEYELSYNYDDGFIDGYTLCQENMADELIRFARMHVKAALETVVENINPEKGKYIISNKESILSLYNLDNIK